MQDTGGDEHQIQHASIRLYRFGCAGDRRLVFQIEPLVPHLGMLRHRSGPAARRYPGDGGTCAQDAGQRPADATGSAHHYDAHPGAERVEWHR